MCEESQVDFVQKINSKDMIIAGAIHATCTCLIDIINQREREESKRDQREEWKY